MILRKILRKVIFWWDEEECVLRCPICMKYIETKNWISHLSSRHQQQTLEREFPDVDLIYYLAGVNDEYGRRTRTTEEEGGGDEEDYEVLLER